MTVKNPNIAIDGPAAGGKTTVAKILASHLGLVYLDTGAMYRASAYEALKNGIDIHDSAAVEKMTVAMHLDMQPDAASAAGHKMIANGEDITSELHSPEVSTAVSVVAAIPAVRRDMVRRQQEFAARGGVVMAGRDIGSVVMPNAELKFYLDADLKERARRRFADMQASGRDITLEEVEQQLAERDYQDSHRADSPLCIAPGAEVIDCSKISADKVAAIIEKKYQELTNV